MVNKKKEILIGPPAPGQVVVPTPGQIVDPFIEGLNRWQKESKYWAGEVETRQESVEFWQKPDLAMEGLLGERTSVGFQTLTTTTVTPSAEEFRQILEDAQMGVQKAVRNVARSNWFVNFYSMAPSLIATGEIATLQDYIDWTGLSGEGILQPDDFAEAKEAMGAMAPVPGEEEVMGVIEPPVAAPPISMHTLSTQEILKSLTAVTTAQLPPGMTEEELLAIASEMDLPPEALAEIEDITGLVREFSEAAASQEEQIRAVLADLADWELPGQSLKEKALFTMLQPAQAIADLIQPYLHHVSFPLAGVAVHTIQRMMSGEQGMEKLYNEIRSTGRDPWHAMGDAWEEYDLPWYYKLPIEIMTDPITYTPGLLLSGPGKILTRAGARGLPGASRLGRGMLSFNKGLWTAIDLPFDAGKALWARIPKSFAQNVRVEVSAFQDTLQAATTRFTGKPINLVTADDMIQTVEKAVVDFKANPKLAGLGNASIDLGKYLYEFTPMNADDILLWSKSLGGKLTAKEVSPTVITSVNDVLRDTLMRVGSNAENAKRAAIALLIDDNPKKIATLIKDINKFTMKRTTNVARSIEIGRTAQISPVLRMTEYLVSRQRAIINATLKSPDASARHMNGVVRWLVNEVDQIERLRWRLAMDRFLVRPMAEAYLGSIAYPIWNAFEGMFVTAMEGIVPRQARQESFQRMVQGLTGVDPRLMEWSAGDIPGMLGTMPGREGAISFLPGKIPEKVGVLKTPKWLAGKDYLEWTGRKWIQFSDVWGTAYRANFVMKKMSNYLAELSLKTAGGDINLAVSRLMGKTPRISKKTLGITEKDLKNDMWMRVASGNKKEVLAAKELWSNSSLMQGEQLKILRRADQLSPQARTLGEQSIARGEAITTTDTINVYCKQLADQSVADLQAFPVQVADTFEFLADDVARMEIRTADDLMSTFQGYEVMVDTAGSIPHKMMSKIHADADELRRLGKYKQVEQLWRSSRTEMQDAIYKVDLSLESVRAKLLANSGLLKPEQQVAFNTLVERASVRDALRESTLKVDGELLSNFWSIPKAARSPMDYSDLRATREALWLEFRKENAVIGAGEFLQRRSYAELYKDLPKPRLHRVDALSRALSPDDVSKVMGCNVDAISTGITENMAMQDRYFFIQMVKQSADANPNLFKGFTEEKISRVYDDILQSMHMRPDIDIAQQKILQQVEGVKQEMIALRMTKSLTPQEELALHAWIDKIATGMDNVIGDKGLITTADWNALRQEALGMAHKDYYKAFADYTHQNVIDAAMKTIYPYWSISEDTEVMTRDGWKHYWELGDSDELLSFSKDTELTYWDKLQYVNIYDYDGDAIWLYDKGRDSICTPNHWWLVKKPRNDEWEFVLAEELASNMKFPKAAPHSFDSESLLTPDSAAILGWLVTDGTIKREQYCAYIQQAKQPYVNEIRDLLTRNNAYVSEGVYDDSGCYHFRLTPEWRKQLVGLLDTYGLTYIVSHLSAEAAESMWQAMWKAEGCNRTNCFVQKEGEVLDAFELLSFLTGRFVAKHRHNGKGDDRDIWQLYIHKTNHQWNANLLIDRVPYKGKMWCPSVEHRTILIRRNGKVCWTGNTYHMYRWFYLPRVFAHRPGVLSAWGKYYNYSDYGYTHIPGTDLEINPFVGSVFGATFGLARHDFKTYYENLGEMGEALDYSQRFGFFPGIHIMLPIVVSPLFSGRPPELGGALPPIARFGLNLLTASPIPGVKDAADWLYDRVFHENFRDYYTATVLSGMQVEAGGKLIDGQSGVDLWFKMQRGEKLTDEEQKVWDDASTKTGWYNVLRSQFPIFRLREEEMLEAFQQVSKIFEEQLGLTPEMQDYLWRHNLKPTDIVGGLPLDLRMALDEMWQWRIWFGRGAILMPPHISDLYGMIDKYWGKVRGYQEERIATQTEVDTGFTEPTKTIHYDGREWREEYANNWSAYAARVESIEADPEFTDAIDAMTPEGQARLAKTLGFSTPTRHPLEEALDLYFSLELVKTADPVTGEEDWNYIKFWQEREAVRRALTDEQRQDFDNYLRRYSTPMERLFKDVTNTYFRGYWAVSRIILDEFDEEQIALIKEFYADATTLTRKEELREITDPKTGRKLISLYESMSSESRQRLREASPHLDYWLYAFGYITKPLTPESRALVDKFDADRTIIIRDYLESAEVIM